MRARCAMAAVLGLVSVAWACGGDQPDQVVVAGVDYAPDGTLAILTIDGIFLIDSQLDDSPKGHIALRGLPAFQQFNLYQYSLSADGTVAAVSYSSGISTTAPISVELYRLPTGEVLNSFRVALPTPGDLGSEMLALALSPHGDLVAAQVYDRSTVFDSWIAQTSAVRVYRTDGTALSTVPLPQAFVSSITLSPDEQFVATSTGTPTWASGYNDADVYRISDGTRRHIHLRRAV